MTLTTSATQADQNYAGPIGLQIFDELPSGCIAYRLQGNEAAPLVESGEIVVVDIVDRILETGSIYLRRIVSCDGRATISVCELISKPWTRHSRSGPSIETAAFFFVAHNRPRAVGEWQGWAARNGGFIPMADGPFFCSADEDMAYWKSQCGTVVGRVIGILGGDQRPPANLPN